MGRPGFAAGAPAAWRVSLAVPVDVVEAFESAFADLADAVAVSLDQDSARLDATFDRRPDGGTLAARVALAAAAAGLPEPSLAIEKVPATDWLAATRAAFPPIRIGRFCIYGSHVDAPGPAGTIGLCIDAATAFGTGEHPSTAGCLTALDRVARRSSPRRVLDIGCGTGILAMAAAKLWHRAVLASDIDAEAVRVAGINAASNGLGRLVRPVRADGFAARVIAAGAPYDLITANILARPLKRLALPLSRRLAHDGAVVLSGLLKRDAPSVLSAYRMCGLRLIDRIEIAGWSTLVIGR